MAKWWPFGRKDKDQAPAPASEAPRPQPTPAPTPAEEPRKPGRFQRALDKLRGRKKKKKEEAPAAPESSSAPPSTPTAEPSPPQDGGEPAPAGEPGEPGVEGGEGQEEAEDPYADAPLFLTITIPGSWVTSKRTWNGVVQGTLFGEDIVDFLKAMDGVPGYDLNDSVQKVCDDFDAQFGAAVDVDASTYSTPQY
ncbi:hypothetical protein [Streptomyces sp. NPDC087300]|uniref:hypothetical protein n=1 Tax=Streptomyces sp. NPDC087300 TaxID=3365780 RepID=UPI0038085376